VFIKIAVYSKIKWRYPLHARTS